MELTPKQKAQMLLSQLGDNATSVLSKLTKKSAMLLTSNVKDIPEVDDQILAQLSKEIVDKLDLIRINQDAKVDFQQENSTIPEKEIDEDISPFVVQKQVVEEVNLEREEPLVNIEKKPTDKSENNVSKTSDSVVSNNKIADVLKDQKPQIIAFLLSKYDEDQRDDIVAQLPMDLQVKVDALNIEDIPLSDSIYDRLHNSILKEIKKRDQLALEEANSGVDEDSPSVEQESTNITENVSLTNDTSSFNSSSDSLFQDESGFQGNISFD